MVEQNQKKIVAGTPLVFSHLIPDFHYFKGSEGGRTLPMLHPSGEANLAPGLVASLSSALGVVVAPADVVAYLAGIAAHPGFTAHFHAELETPGVRVPITADPHLWEQAVDLGRQVLWAHTYGEAFDGPERPTRVVRYPAGHPRQIGALEAVQGLPDGHSYDAATQQLIVGTGRFGPVTREVFDYTVGGRNVIKSWVDYRKQDPAGKKSTPLDHINPASWEHTWTGELVELLTVLDRLTQLEGAQERLLATVLAGQLLPSQDLSDLGTKWGTSKDPRHHASLRLDDA